MDIKTTEEIANDWNDLPEWDDAVDYKKWVSVDDLKEYLDNLDNEAEKSKWDEDYKRGISDIVLCVENELMEINSGVDKHGK